MKKAELKKRVQELEAKILSWHNHHKEDVKFTRYFGISSIRDGVPEKGQWIPYPNGKFKVYRFGHRVYPNVKDYAVNTDDPKYTSYLVDHASITIDVWDKFCKQYPKYFDVWQYIKSLPLHIRNVKEADPVHRIETKFSELFERVLSLESKMNGIIANNKCQRNKGFLYKLFNPNSNI